MSVLRVILAVSGNGTGLSNDDPESLDCHRFRIVMVTWGDHRSDLQEAQTLNRGKERDPISPKPAN